MSAIPSQRGFTLLELLVVIGIVSVLAMVALPAYQDYITRTKVVEDFGTVKQVQMLVTEYYSINGVMPETMDQLGLKHSMGLRLRWVQIMQSPKPGSIQVYWDERNALPELGERKSEIRFVPEVRNGRVMWSCKYGSMLDKFRPSTCRRD